MSGLRLKNTSPLTLEGGSITVLDGDAYAGESLMERLKPAETRFISFALDLGTLVTAKQKAQREPVFLVRAVNGVFQAHYHQAEKKVYTITNQTDRARLVYIEHPVRDGWVLTDDTQKPASTTANVYRFRVELGPRATAEIPVVERRALMDSYQLSSLTPRDVELFVAGRFIDDAIRAALENIVDLKVRVVSAESRLASLETEVEEIEKDQTRLRENIKALKDTLEAKHLITRYVAKANEQESRMEQLSAERKSATESRGKLQSELESAIRGLSLDERLAGGGRL